MAKLSKKQIREMRRRRYKCCLKAAAADTGRFSKGLHTHDRMPKAHDAATGTGFLKDASTTKAVLKRMKALGVIE